MNSSVGKPYDSGSKDPSSIPKSVTLGLGPGQPADLGHSDLDLECPNYGSDRFFLTNDPGLSATSVSQA